MRLRGTLLLLTSLFVGCGDDGSSSSSGGGAPAPYTVSGGAFGDGHVIQENGTTAGQQQNTVVTDTQSNGHVRKASGGDTSMETSLLTAINNLRITPVTGFDLELERGHARHMLENGFFSNVTPEGQTWGDRHDEEFGGHFPGLIFYELIIVATDPTAALTFSPAIVTALTDARLQWVDVGVIQTTTGVYVATFGFVGF